MSCIVHGALHLSGCNRNETFGCLSSMSKMEGGLDQKPVVKYYNIYKDKNIPQHMIECWERNTQA